MPSNSQPTAPTATKHRKRNAAADSCGERATGHQSPLPKHGALTERLLSKQLKASNMGLKGPAS